MGFLGGRMNKPRAFNHQYIYVDTRKEKLQKMEEKAKIELGILPENKEFNREDIKGKFSEKTVHLKKYKNKEKRPYFAGVAIVLILLLIFLWRYLLTGEWTLF